MKKPNGTNSVYKSGDLWIGQIVIGKYDNGNLKYKRFTSKKQTTVLERMREYESGNVTKSSTATSIYLGDYLLNYLNSVKKNSIKPTSFDRDMNTYSIIKRYIGDYTLNDITPLLVQDSLLNTLKLDGYSYSTTHKVFVLLNECMRYATDHKIIPDNPCRTVKQPSKNTFEQKEIRFLNEAEIEAFIKAATVIKPNGKPFYSYGLFICLDIYTGLRCGELVALKWGDIDFENKYINVNKIISTEYEYNEDGSKKNRIVQCKGTTKTSSGKRIVNLNTKSLKILNDIKEMYHNDISAENYVISNTTQCKSVDVVSDSYTNIAEAAGIENHLGIHTLRHTFASLLIKRGVDIKIVSELLGHKDVAFTYNTYVHLIDEQKAKAVDLLDLD